MVLPCILSEVAEAVGGVDLHCIRMRNKLCLHYQSSTPMMSEGKCSELENPAV